VREGLGLAEPNYSSGAYGAGSDSWIAAAFAIPGDEEVGAFDVTENLAANAGDLDDLADTSAANKPTSSWEWKTRPRAWE
jgi:hypothetical protein